MESNTYKIKLQKIKGSWVTYVFMLAAGLLFFNKILALAAVLIGLALMIKYKKDPYNTSAIYYNFAIKLYGEKDFTKAKQALATAINYNKENKDAYFFLGCILFDEKDYKNALTYLKQGGAEEINDPSLVFVLGRCYYHEGNYEKAINLLEMITYDGLEYLERERLFALGRSYVEIEEYEKAVVALEKSNISLEELKGDSLEYAYYLAVAYFHTENDVKANEFINRVYETDKYYKFIDVYAKEIGIA